MREQVDECGGGLTGRARVDPAVVRRGVDAANRIGEAAVEPAANAGGREIEGVPDAGPTHIRVVGRILANAAVIEDRLPRIRILPIAVGSGESLGRGLHVGLSHVNGCGRVYQIFTADIYAIKYIRRLTIHPSNQQPIGTGGAPFRR